MTRVEKKVCVKVREGFLGGESRALLYYYFLGIKNWDSGCGLVQELLCRSPASSTTNHHVPYKPSPRLGKNFNSERQIPYIFSDLEFSSESRWGLRSSGVKAEAPLSALIVKYNRLIKGQDS